MEQLLATGASPNVPDHAGLTAMHVCSGVCLSGPSSGGLSSPRNPGQRSKQHAGIPAALLAAGGDIFEATVDSAGRRRPPPLLCGGRSVWSMHSAAATAFLEHAAQAHEQGRWVAPVDLSALVRLAVHLRCRPFFHRFWQRGQYYNSIYQLEVCAVQAPGVA